MMFSSFCTKTLNGHDDWVRKIIASEDGKTLASCSNDQTIRIWSVDTGKETACLRGHTHVVETIAFANEAAHPVINVSMRVMPRKFRMRTQSDFRALKVKRRVLQGRQSLVQVY